MKHDPLIVSQAGKLPLPVVLVLPFILQIFTAVGLTGYVSLRNGQKAVNDVASQLRSELTARIQQQIRTYVETPHSINQINANALIQETIDPIALAGINQLWQQAKIFNTTNLIYCASEVDGSMVGVGYPFNSQTMRVVAYNRDTQYTGYYYELDDQGQPDQLVRQNRRRFDARRRPWYVAAKAAGKPTWSEIYLDFDTLFPTITASAPAYEPVGNQLIGVCATDFLLPVELSNFLQKLEVGENGETFIISRSGTLISSSIDEKLLVGQGERTRQRLATESQSALVRETAAFLNNRFDTLEDIEGAQQLEFKLNRQRQYVQVAPFNDERGLDWLIVLVAPESDFMEQIQANTRTTIWLCLAALTTATGFGILTTRWITRPILRLIAISKRLTQRSPKRQIERIAQRPFQTMGIREIDILTNSFNRMADQLSASFNALAYANTELEGRVRERTADLQQAKEEADAANRAKSEFLANMSHELRTPLNAILGFTQLLMRDASLPQKHYENLEVVNNSGEHLLALINDVLEMSKIEAGRITLNEETVDLFKVIDSLEGMLRFRAESKQLQLDVQIATEGPQFVRTDEGKLRQVLLNLLGNAIKFTQSGRVELQVTVATYIPDTCCQQDPSETSDKRPLSKQALVFRVSDTGVGIPETDLEVIFDAFIQAKITKRSQRGTGLGLAISRQFVKLVGGDIIAHSVLGKGSTFIFDIPLTLPKFHQGDSRQTRPQVIALAADQPSHQILVVDDQLDNRSALCQLLMQVGFEVFEAADGEEAIALYKEHHPRLIWMDMRMPVMDGYEATRRIRAMESGGDAGTRGRRDTGKKVRGEWEDAGTRGRGDAGKKVRGEWEDAGTRGRRDTGREESGNEEVGGDSAFCLLPSAFPRPIIIALTASVFEEKREAVMAAGCDDFVRKPYREAIIFEKMAEYLGVEYVYADAGPMPLTPPSDEFDAVGQPLSRFSTAALRTMPTVWVDRFYQAAVQVDGDRLHALIQQMPASQSQLARQLTHLVHQFEYDRIINWIESFREK